VRLAGVFPICSGEIVHHEASKLEFEFPSSASGFLTSPIAPPELTATYTPLRMAIDISAQRKLGHQTGDPVSVCPIGYGLMVSFMYTE
jgi:hypothetical protein